MDPQVVAAIIAAVVSVLTLVGTLAAQYLGRYATSRDTEKTFEEQRKHLDRTLAEQSRQLDRTLAEQKTRTLNERFATAADQLGSDKPAAVRLAGVYAMAGLADDWEANRQTCVDVICGYLRMPYEPNPGRDSSASKQLAFQSSREVRLTVIRIIAAHLKDDAAVSWQNLNFDFTSVIFDGGSFANSRFSGRTVSFRGAQFSGGIVDFRGAEFSADTVNFAGAKFSGGIVDFGASFSSGTVIFRGADFSGGKVSFRDAAFSGSAVIFNFANFSGGTVSFSNAEFSGGTVDFSDAKFSGGTVDLSAPRRWSYPPKFSWAGIAPSGVELPASEMPDPEPA